MINATKYRAVEAALKEYRRLLLEQAIGDLLLRKADLPMPNLSQIRAQLAPVEAARIAVLNSAKDLSNEEFVEVLMATKAMT